MLKDSRIEISTHVPVHGFCDIIVHTLSKYNSGEYNTAWYIDKDDWHVHNNVCSREMTQALWDHERMVRMVTDALSFHNGNMENAIDELIAQEMLGEG